MRQSKESRRRVQEQQEERGAAGEMGQLVVLSGIRHLGPGATAAKQQQHGSPEDA